MIFIKSELIRTKILKTGKNSKNSEIQSTKRDQKRNNYFSQKILDEVKDNIKDTWKVLNIAMGNKSKTTNISCLEVKSNLLSNPQRIANELNEYFCNTAKRVSEEFPQSDEKVRALDSNANLTYLPKKFQHISLSKNNTD